MTIETEEAKPTIIDRSIILSLRMGTFGNRRKVNSTSPEFTTDVDRTLIHIGKSLIDSEDLLEIWRIEGKIRAFITARSLPNLFRAGLYLIPLALFEEIDNRLLLFQEERDNLITQFLKVYPEKIEEARGRLRGLFNPLDYPTEENIREKFTWEVRYLSLGVPDRLKSISELTYSREQEKAARFWEQTALEVRDALRECFLALISHLADRLEGAADGKPKVFRDSTIQNLEEFFETFRARNLADDEKLDELVSQAKQILRGTNAKDLRKDQSLREQIRERLSPIKISLDKMLQDRPKRKISFEEEDL